MSEGKDDSQKKQRTIRARRKMMDYLARRDHSEQELRKKLIQKMDDRESIEEALDYGKENGWIPKDNQEQTQLALRMAEVLHRKLKGIHHINKYLNEKGLPPVKPDLARELEKAQLLLENKFSPLDRQDDKLMGKATRFLASRGFEMNVIRQVIFKR